MIFRATPQQTRQHYSSIFKLFDNSSCGYICCNRLEEVAKEIGHDCSHEEIVEMLKRADKDVDGLISEDEFYQIMTKQSN
jgi:Ca2+-binding EF-hand superfamily protein